MKVKVLHISDSFAYSSLGEYVEEERQNLSSPEEIVEQIYREKKYLSADLFLISLNYKIEGKIERSQSKGIMLLKLLRLRGCLKHCVLYSFLPREYYIEKDPTALILYSPGVTFVQLPADLPSLSYADLSKKEASYDLKAYFKAESILPDNRHFFANWWGILKLWEVQKVVEKQSGETAGKDFELPESLLKEKNSYHGLLARYVHDMPEEDVEKALEYYNSEVRKSEEEAEQNQKLLHRLGELKPQEKESGEGNLVWDNDRLVSFYRKVAIEGLEQELQSAGEDANQRKEDFQNKLSTLQKKTNREEDLKRRIGGVLPSDDNSSSKSTQDLRKSLREKALRILYVDDQANDGWAEVIQRMVYGKSGEDQFSVIVPKKEEGFDPKRLADEIIEKVREGVDLLILDLRLQGEADKNLALSEVSGMRVLSVLREHYFPYPVLITTASNKVWTYKETLAQGAMAFWVKQGLDADNSVEATVENYQSLLRTIYWLCFHKDIQSLFSLPKAMLELYDCYYNRKERAWWLDLALPEKQENLPAKTLRRLWDTFEIYRSFINATLSPTKFDEHMTKLQYATIVNSMHLIFEDLFPKGESDERTLAQRMVDNGCEHLRFFLAIRNTAAHTGVCVYCVAHEYIIHLIELLKSESVRRIGRVESVEYNKRYQSWTLELTQQSGCEEPVWLYSRKNGNDRIHESIEEKLPAGMISEVLIAEEFVGKNVEYTLTIDPKKGTHYANYACLVGDSTVVRERCNEYDEKENTGMLE